jgi:hypothetical protein
MRTDELLAEMHPGRTILEDVLRPLGMSVNALAKELHVPTPRLNDIVRGPARCHGRYRAPPGALPRHDGAVLAQSSVHP